jgi:hypothetical protein
MTPLDRGLRDAKSIIGPFVFCSLVALGCDGGSGESALEPRRERWSHRADDRGGAPRRAAALQADIGGAKGERAVAIARYDALEACALEGTAPSSELVSEQGDPWQNDALRLMAGRSGGSVPEWQALVRAAEDREDSVALAWCRANLGFAILASAPSLEGPAGLKILDDACQEFALAHGVPAAALDEAACHAFRARFVPPDARKRALEMADRALDRLRIDVAAVSAMPGSFLGLQPIGHRIAFVIDASESMKPSMGRLREAVRASVCSLPAGSAWSIIAFSGGSLPMEVPEGSASEAGMVPVRDDGGPSIGPASDWLEGLVAAGDADGMFQAVSEALDSKPSVVFVLTDGLPPAGPPSLNLAKRVEASGVPVFLVVTDIERQERAGNDVEGGSSIARSIAGTKGAFVPIRGALSKLPEAADPGGTAWSGRELLDELKRSGRWTPRLERQRALIKAQIVLMRATDAAIADSGGATDLDSSAEAQDAFKSLASASSAGSGSAASGAPLQDWQGRSVLSALSNAIGNADAGAGFEGIADSIKAELDRVKRDTDTARHESLREFCARAHLLSALCATQGGASDPFERALAAARGHGVVDGTWSGMLLSVGGGELFARSRALSCADAGPESATRVAEVAAVLAASGSSDGTMDDITLGRLYCLPTPDADVFVRAARRATRSDQGANP